LIVGWRLVSEAFEFYRYGVAKINEGKEKSHCKIGFKKYAEIISTLGELDFKPKRRYIFKSDRT